MSPCFCVSRCMGASRSCWDKLWQEQSRRHVLTWTRCLLSVWEQTYTHKARHLSCSRLSNSPPVCLFCLSVHLSVYHFYLSFHLPVRLLVCLSVSLSLWKSTCLFCLSVYPYMPQPCYLYVCLLLFCLLPVFLFVCLSSCLSVCLSVVCHSLCPPVSICFILLCLVYLCYFISVNLSIYLSVSLSSVRLSVCLAVCITYPRLQPICPRCIFPNLK